MNARRMNRRGFTLIEVMLVILILAMLGGLAIVATRGTKDKAGIKTTRLLVEITVPDALDKYEMDIRHYPTDDEGGLDALWKKPNFDDETTDADWVAHLKKEPKDAWRNPLHYELVDDPQPGEPPYRVWSDGPDKENGTDDDIKNWSEDDA